MSGIEKAVVLLSGGIDSSTLLHYVRRRPDAAEVHALSFRYGQRHARELDMARWQAAAAGVREHAEIDVSFLAGIVRDASSLVAEGAPVPDMKDLAENEREQPRTYVPNRNMVLLAVAAAYAEARGIRDIFYGAQRQDGFGYWDCSARFVDRLNRTLRLNRRTPVTVHAPFVAMSKGAVVKIGLAMGMDYGHTWTCYRGGRTPCGTCPSCVERSRAFAEAGADDPGVPAGRKKGRIA